MPVSTVPDLEGAAGPARTTFPGASISNEIDLPIRLALCIKGRAAGRTLWHWKFLRDCLWLFNFVGLKATTRLLPLL